MSITLQRLLEFLPYKIEIPVENTYNAFVFCDKSFGVNLITDDYEMQNPKAVWANPLRNNEAPMFYFKDEQTAVEIKLRFG